MDCIIVYNNLVYGQAVSAAYHLSVHPEKCFQFTIVIVIVNPVYMIIDHHHRGHVD